MEQEAIIFREKLADWANNHLRPLPWKAIQNPYFIWLSEIILQQTRVEQGRAYYLKFIENYPTIHDLANAPEDEVMKCWEGLGYYSRARNLHATAKHISQQLNGIFPSNYQDILTLKGVGPYTAAAIASFAFSLPHAVVDGNVYRVLSRYFGIETPIDSNEGIKQFSALANALLDQQQPAKYNQAIMDFGATHCTPAAPACVKCNFQKKCIAFREKKTAILPIKSKKIIKKNRYFHYLIFTFLEKNLEKSVEKKWIKKRIEKDIWQDLYEFPLIVADALLSEIQLFDNHFFTKLFLSNISAVKVSKTYKQQLTHQTVFAQFYEIRLENNTGWRNEIPSDWLEVSNTDIKKFAFPKIIDLYFTDKNVTLSLF